MLPWRTLLSASIVLVSVAVGACSTPEDEPTGEGEEHLTLQANVKGSVGDQVRVLSVAEIDAHRFSNDDGLPTWEGIVDRFGSADPEVHLVDQVRFPDGHFPYTQQALGRPDMTKDQFFTEVSFPNARRYMPFQVYDFRAKPLRVGDKTFQWGLNIRRYNYRDDEGQLADVLENLRALLSERLMKGFGEPALYVYETNIPSSTVRRRPHVTERATMEGRGFTLFAETEARGLCTSATLKETVFAGTCVQRADRGQAWFRCGGGGPQDWPEIGGPTDPGCNACPQLGGACP